MDDCRRLRAHKLDVKVCVWGEASRCTVRRRWEKERQKERESGERETDGEEGTEGGRWRRRERRERGDNRRGESVLAHARLDLRQREVLVLDLIRSLLNLEVCELDLRPRFNHSVLQLVKRLLHLGVQPWCSMTDTWIIVRQST